jgi:hypothetical protein
VVSADGTERSITEGTAVHLGEDARRIDVAIADEVLLKVQVFFDLRPSVKERQAALDDVETAGSAED